MKLQLQHLAPYLPYGLKMKHYENNRIGTLQGVSTNTLGQPYSLCVNTNWYNPFVYKPILRPLSDLTKEIEVNGEKFVPIERFYEFIDNVDFLDQMLEDINSNNSIANWQYDVVNKLLEWHFDVFGLIEQKIAIDINTLEL